MIPDGIERPLVRPVRIRLDADAHHIAWEMQRCQHRPFAEFVFSRAVPAAANPGSALSALEIY